MADTQPESELSLGKLLRDMGAALVGLTLIVGLAAWTLQAPLERLSHWFVDQFGLAGVFFGILVMDALPATTHEPMLFIGYEGGLGFWPVFFAGSTASVLSGYLGYLIGMVVGNMPWVKAQFERYHIYEFYARYGRTAVIVAALTPFPYSIATWAAGATRLSMLDLTIGCLFRIPKVLFYFSLIVGVWNSVAT
jgi:membrane protein YqaA with SNARE-associated domain